MFPKISRGLLPTPGVAIAFLALVLAVTGGAFAATGDHGSPGSTKSPNATVAKAKAKTGPRGPAGPKGATGSAGATGPAGATGLAGATGPGGAQGPQGPQGPAGNNGEKGANGINGTSVTSKEVKAGEAACNKEGGSEFTTGSTKTYACNGEKGVLHPGETLPKGATETGTWAAEGVAAATGEYVGATISFPVRLAEKGEVNAVYVAVGESTSSGTLAEQCEGDVENPGAKPGDLCVFEGESPAIHHGGLESYGHAIVSPDGGIYPGPTGGQLVFKTTQTGRVSAEGTWAVTEG
jgi:hypothetical protein